MINRRSKRNSEALNDSSEKQETSKRDIGTITDEHSSECLQDSIEMVQSPVFHIHIHVPGNSNQNTSKMYLPRIQPVIHLHYDELAKKLRNNEMLESRKLNQRYLERVVSQSTPKFGNVIFHYKNNSYRGDLDENELITSTPQRISRSTKRKINDLETNGSEISNIIPNETSESGSEITNNVKGNSSDDCVSEDSNVKSSSPAPSYDSNIKLKKAVVVLTDITKLKTFKCNMSHETPLGKKSKTGKSPVSSRSKKIESSSPQIKVECESSSCRSESPPLSDKQSECTGGGDGVEDTRSNTKCSEMAKEELSWKRESLESLVEGCNFSEILRRFKGKNSKLIGNSLRNSKCSSEEENLGKLEEGQVEKVIINENISVLKNSFENLKEINTEQLQSAEKTNRESKSANRNILRDLLERNRPTESEIQDYPNSRNKESKCLTGENYLNNSSSSEDVKDLSEHLNVTNRNESEQLLANFDTLKNEVNMGNRLEGSSKNVSNFTTAEVNSNTTASDVVIKNEICSEDMTNEPMLMDVEDQNILSELSEKETNMKRSPTTIGMEKREKKKRSSNSQSKDSPAGKKIKSVEKNIKKSEEKGKVKSSGEESYIPLVVPGPTAFAVAPLGDVQAYKTHDAKTFKSDMLFGNRVHRYSNSNQLQVYKMKKEAAGRRYN